MSTDTLSMWTVYAHPRDYPDDFVARRSEVLPGGLIGMTNDMFAVLSG